MNMKKLMGLMLASLVAAVSLGAEVTTDMARTAMRNWRAQNGTLGLTMGRDVVDARCVTSSGVKFHVVRFAGGGVAITSADTKIRPVIMFSDGSDFDEDPDNPAWDILKADLAAPTGTVRKVALKAAAPTAQPPLTANERAWAELLEEDSLEYSSADAIDDVRVAPLVQTHWAQSVAGGGRCYNYYTPNNYVCGCVATALAQIMRTFEYPASTTYVAPYTGKYCKVDGETTTLTTQGGYYNWADMPYSPSSSMTEAQRQAIGKLTSDVGICLAMQYADGGSGSHTYMAQWVLENCYGYKSAMAVKSLTSHGVGDDFQRILISNFDAKLPVQIGLSGHSIVGDGYGYDKDGGLWYHLNFGWSNTAPAWYRPPTEDDPAPQGYTAFAGGVYNIYTERDGKYVIASGRVTDDQGRPVSGKSVSAVAYANPGVVAATATTDEHGIYALFVEPGEYLVSVAYEREDGKGIYSGSTAANALKCVSLRIAENAGTYSTPKPAMGNAAFCDIQLVKEDYLTAMLDGLKQNGSAVSLGAGEIGWRTSDGQIGKLKNGSFTPLSGTLTYRLAYSPDDQDASVLRVHDGTLAAEHLTTDYMSQFSSIAAVSKVTDGTLDASAVTAYATPLALGAGVFSLADGEAKTVTVDGTLTLRGGATLRIDATAEGCDSFAATVLDLSGATAMNPFVIDLVNAGASPRDLANGLTLVAVASKTLADGPLANVLVRLLDGSDPLQAVIRHGDLVCVSSAAMLDCLKGDGKLVHIDSGYHVKTNSYVTLDTLFGNSTTVQRAFGTFASDSGTANEMELLLYGWDDSKYYAYLGNSKGRKSVCSLPRDTSRHLFEFDALKRAVYVDSTQKGKLDPNYDAATAPSVNALGFFFYNGYTGGMSELNSYQTIYGARVYEYDAAGVEKSMVGDYVPWRTAVGAVGFYDTVKGEFHGPSASYRDYTAYAPAWNLAYRQFDDTPTVLSLYDGTLAPEHLTTAHMKRFTSITAVEKLTDGTLAAGAVTAYATPLTLGAGVFSLADGAAKTVTVDGTLTLRGGATLRIDATAEGCDTIAATAVDLSGATAENPLAIEIEGSGLDWSVPRTVLATGVTGEGVVDCVRVTGGGQPLVAKAVDGALVVSAFFVTAENVVGHDFTNGVVRVNVEDSSGAKVRLRVTDPVTGESKTTEAREPSAAALAWDLTEAFGRPLTPGRVYSYEVEMVVQDKAVVARTGEFTAANWNVAFGAKVEGGTETVTGGAWTTKPAVQADGYTLDDEALFGVHAKTSDGISRVDTKVTFVDVCREADLADTVVAMGGVTIAESANGATNWMAYTSAGWVTLAGAGAPAPDRQYVVRCEIDCLTSPGRLRYSVSSDGGASFAPLTANGTAWQPCPDGLTALSKVRFAGSGELAKLESNFADKALAEVGGVKYDTLAEAMAAAGDGDITLLTNVRIVPTQSGRWSFLKGGFDALVDLSKLRNATYSWEGGILKVTCATGMVILLL